MKYSAILKNDLISLLGNFINIYSYKIEKVDNHSKKIFFDIPEDKIEDLRKAIMGSSKLIKIDDSIRKTSSGYVVYSESGKKMSKPYKTKEEAEKRLRQIEYFKHMNDSVNDTFIYNGKEYWCGAVNTLDGKIEEVHTYKEAKIGEFHHSFIFSQQQVEEKLGIETAFFYVNNKGQIIIDPMGRSYEEIDEFFLIDKIKEQIKIINEPKVDLSNLHLEEIDDSIIIHETLNEKLWNDDKTLKKEVSDKIKEIVEKFQNWVKEDEIDISIKDIIIIGSNASYNYTNKSDLDIHIIVNEKDPILLKTYDLYKSLFNDNYDIKFNDIKVELYVQNDISELKSNGIFSLNTGWIQEPIKETIPTDEKEGLNELVDKFKEKYEKLVKNPSVDEIDKVIDEIYALRKHGLETEGEYALENLVFKNLRDLKIIEKLKTLKTLQESKELSIEDSKGVKDMTINGTLEEFEPKELVEKVKERKEPLHTNRTYGKDIYMISLDAFGTVEEPRSIYVDVIRLRGKDQKRIKMEKVSSWDEAVKIMEDIKKEILSTEKKELKFPHLEEAIKKLNAPSIIDGEEYESLFDFDYRVEDDLLYIFDKNEAYSIDWALEQRELAFQTAEEFHQPKPEMDKIVDRVHEELEKAVKADLGEDAILDWENNVRMVTGIPEKFFTDSLETKKLDYEDDIIIAYRDGEQVYKGIFDEFIDNDHFSEFEWDENSKSYKKENWEIKVLDL